MLSQLLQVASVGTAVAILTDELRVALRVAFGIVQGLELRCGLRIANGEHVRKQRQRVQIKARGALVLVLLQHRKGSVRHVTPLPVGVVHAMLLEQAKHVAQIADPAGGSTHHAPLIHEHRNAVRLAKRDRLQ